MKLLRAIQAEAAGQGLVQDILREVNVGQEQSKSGFRTDEIPAVIEQISEFPNIFVRGLMAIPPISQKLGDNRKFFQEIFNLSVDIKEKKYDNVRVDCLSMGMTNDYADAIACGSTDKLHEAIIKLKDFHYNTKT